MDPLQGERQEVEVILDVIRSEGSLDLRVLGLQLHRRTELQRPQAVAHETNGIDLLLLGNATGDLQPDLSIRLTGISTLDSTDLLLA